MEVTMAEAFGIACHELVSLDFCCGSTADQQTVHRTGPLSEVKQTKLVKKLTFGL